MPRFDLKTVRPMVGHAIGAVIPQDEWVTWHNAPAWIEQGYFEILADGEPVTAILRDALLVAISKMAVPVRRLVPGPLPAATAVEKKQAAKKTG